MPLKDVHFLPSFKFSLLSFYFQPVRFKLNHGVYKKTQEREFSLWVGDIDKEVGEDELYRAFSGRYTSIRTARSEFIVLLISCVIYFLFQEAVSCFQNACYRLAKNSIFSISMCSWFSHWSVARPMGIERGIDYLAAFSRACFYVLMAICTFHLRISLFFLMETGKTILRLYFHAWCRWRQKDGRIW